MTPDPLMIAVDRALCRLSARRSLKIDAFRLYAGQHWCVFGGNGAGKSLFASLICGHLLMGRSHVRYGRNFDPRRDIAMVSFEAQQKLQREDARHDISEFSATAHDPGTTVASLVGKQGTDTALYSDLMARFGLLELQDRGIRYLSSGQLRRAMIARALCRQPRLLILDEPLESIDRCSRKQIADALRQWQSGNNASLVLNRRADSLLPGMTHRALMDGLTMVASGPATAVPWETEPRGEGGPLLRRRSTSVPARLPPPVRGHVPFNPPRHHPLIALNDIHVSYGDRKVLNGISWTMEHGQHTLIEGPNGCGKSTLLNLISGENHKAYGQDIMLFGQRRGSGESVWQVKSRFGIVSNELHNRYPGGWKALDVVISGFHDSIGLYEVSSDAGRVTAREWLKAFGLDGVAAENYHELSFGEQRMVLLARAMIKHPPVLILDEPAVGLDDHYRRLLPEALTRIAGSGRTHIIYVSHGDDLVPSCINQSVTFEPDGEQGYRVISH